MATPKSAAAGPWTEDNIEEMLKHMDLQDNELDDVVLGKSNVEQMEADTRLLGVGRPNTDRPFSATTMFETMKFAWGLAHIYAKIQ